MKAINDKPAVPRLPSKHASEQKWFDALQPRLKLAEWAHYADAAAKLDASNVLTAYFDNCPNPYSDLQDLANDEIQALDLAIADEQLAALEKNRAEYDEIGKVLRDASKTL